MPLHAGGRDGSRYLALQRLWAKGLPGDAGCGHRISIDSWERFDTVKSAILRAPDFLPSTAQPYRVLHKTHAAAYATPIDILPFGEIATEMEAFRWPPPDTDLVMNVAAFGDAYASSITVTAGPGFDLRMASIPGLVLLKLLAWVDKSESKQAQDVLRLIETYGDAGNEDRLYGDDIEPAGECGVLTSL